MKALQVFLLFCTVALYSQSTRWSSFYSFDQITSVHSGAGELVYGVSENSVFSYDPTATGGSVQWDLRSFVGDRVRSGVYLIFVTTNDGLESAVEKVMIIN